MACGHTEAHIIADGPGARETYRRLHERPCGACDTGEW